MHIKAGPIWRGGRYTQREDPYRERIDTTGRVINTEEKYTRRSDTHKERTHSETGRYTRRCDTHNERTHTERG